MKYLKIILFLITFAFGVFWGVVFNDLPKITLDTKVKLFEPLSFLLTATIGLLLPFFIKKWIEDSRHIKNNLIAEFNDTLREVAIIKDKVKFCYQYKSISQSDKQEINVLFEQSDLKISCLEQQLIISYDVETKEIRKDIKDEYLLYWKLTTGAEIMSTSFTVITENFYSRHNDCYSKLETKIKQAIIKVHRI